MTFLLKHDCLASNDQAIEITYTLNGKEVKQNNKRQEINVKNHKDERATFKLHT